MPRKTVSPFGEIQRKCVEKKTHKEKEMQKTNAESVEKMKIYFKIFENLENSACYTLKSVVIYTYKKLTREAKNMTEKQKENLQKLLTDLQEGADLRVYEVRHYSQYFIDEDILEVLQGLILQALNE